MRETVDLDGLAIKIYGKYLKFLQQKVHEIIDRPPTPNVQNDKNQRRDQEEERKKMDAENQNLMADNLVGLNSINPNDTMNFSEIPIESSKFQKAVGLVQNAQRMAKVDNAPPQDLNVSSISAISKYRHENQNSIYYLKPLSQEVYFLDFKRRGFCQEMIKWTKSQSRVLPREFTSQQTTDANIFVIGGYRTSSNENLVLKDCIQIDCNIQAYEREQMKTARYSAPLALIKDRFVLALGGYISKYNITKLSECYDTHTNTWFNIAPLPT